MSYIKAIYLIYELTFPSQRIKIKICDFYIGSAALGSGYSPAWIRRGPNQGTCTEGNYI